MYTKTMNRKRMLQLPCWLPLLALLGSATAWGQDALFIDNSGNVGVGTASPSDTFHVQRADGTAKILVQEMNVTPGPRQLYTLENNGPVGFGMINSDTGDEWRFAAQTTGFRISLGGSGGQEFEVGNDGTFSVGPAGIQNLAVDVLGNLSIQGTLTEGSSRSIKTGITGIEPVTILDKLSELALSEWSYKDDGDTRHLGPMAEDFHALFGLGEDPHHIAPKDLAGVAMASAQALKTKVDRQQHTIERQRERLAEQGRELQALRARLDELETLKEQMTRIEAALPDQVAEVRQ